MEKSTINTSTKDKILDATLNIISTEGFQNVTIRKIAQAANVNVAAVNYHFGSKNNTINKALEYLMLQAKEIFQYLLNDNEDPKVSLKIFVDQYSKNLAKYPDQINNLIYQSIYEKNPTRNTFQEYLKTEGIRLIKNSIQKVCPNDSDMILTLKTMQLLSCLSFPVLLGKRSVEIFGTNLSEPHLRTKYIEMLLENILRY